jgi:hypothetical protein
MNNIIPSLVISVVFFIFKFIDMRFVVKENKPLKTLSMDSLVVFICSLLSLMLLEQFNINELIGNAKENLSAFTNAPDF